MHHRVFIVEDTQSVAEPLRQLLCDLGYEARSYQHGLVAQAAARAEPPDCLIVDGSLPDLPGPILAQNLQREIHGLKVIAIPALFEPDDWRKVHLAAVCQKPFDLNVLTLRLKAALDRT